MTENETVTPPTEETVTPAADEVVTTATDEVVTPEAPAAPPEQPTDEAKQPETENPQPEINADADEAVRTAEETYEEKDVNFFMERITQTVKVKAPDGQWDIATIRNSEDARKMHTAQAAQGLQYKEISF